MTEKDFNKIRQLFCTFLHFWINICTFQLTAKHGMSLMWEVIVCFDDIGGIVDHQCLHILFITCIYCIYQLPFECVFFKDNSSKMCIESWFSFLQNQISLFYSRIHDWQWRWYFCWLIWTRTAVIFVVCANLITKFYNPQIKSKGTGNFALRLRTNWNVHLFTTFIIIIMITE